MSIITVSAGSFLGGKLFAEGLAQSLGFRCVDRETIIARAAAGGVRPGELREALLRPPSVFDRWITHRKYLYLTLLQAALADEVKDGRIVYHGYAGHLLLSGARPVFRIRIIASMELRIEMAEKHLELGKEDALDYIHKVDRERKQWTRYLYGVDWEDPSLYDMILNLGHLLNVEQACEIVADMVRNHKCFEFTPEDQRAMHGFALASRVRAALAADSATAAVHVDVHALNGKVSIAGVFENAEQIREVERVARTVAGVSDVELRY